MNLYQLKFVIFSLFLFLVPNKVNAKSDKVSVMGFKLGAQVEQAKKNCKKQHGKWFASHLNIFTCHTSKYSATVEATGRDTVFSVFIKFNDVKNYNKELNSFIIKYQGIRTDQSGANSTLIHEFNNNVWVASFMSYGKNGNYKVHLYSIKEMITK